MYLAQHFQGKESHLAFEEASNLAASQNKQAGLFLPYLINLIILLIILTDAGLALPIDRDFSHQLLLNNLIFALFYLCAAPFISMLFILAFQAKSIFSKIAGVGLTLFLLYGLMVHRFDSLMNFAIWYAVILACSFLFKTPCQRLYHWLSEHLLRNLKLK